MFFSDNLVPGIIFAVFSFLWYKYTAGWIKEKKKNYDNVPQHELFRNILFIVIPAIASAICFLNFLLAS